MKDLNKFLFATYVLDILNAFSSVSWKILFVQVGSFVNLSILIGHELVTNNILSMLIKLD